MRESQFITKLKVDMVDIKSTNWLGVEKFRRGVILERPFVYYSKLLGRTIVIPSEFVSDGASVPQIFWNIFPPFGKYLESAVIHDYFYYMARKSRMVVDKRTADLIFLEAMQIQDINIAKREIMYNAVKWFGEKFDENQNPII